MTRKQIIAFAHREAQKNGTSIEAVLVDLLLATFDALRANEIGFFVEDVTTDQKVLCSEESAIDVTEQSEHGPN